MSPVKKHENTKKPKYGKQIECAKLTLFGLKGTYPTCVIAAYLTKGLTAAFFSLFAIPSLLRVPFTHVAPHTTSHERGTLLNG